MAREVEGRLGETSWRWAAWGGAAALILGPLFVMRLAGRLEGDPGDFVFAGILVAIVGAAFELAVRTPAKIAYASAIGVALAAAFLLVWANLAVGVIGSEDNPANRVFFLPPAVGLFGAVLVRFKPAGMAAALVAAAAAQVLAAVVALAAGWGFTGPITVFFAALWLASALLFRKAATAQEEVSSGAR